MDNGEKFRILTQGIGEYYNKKLRDLQEDIDLYSSRKIQTEYQEVFEWLQNLQEKFIKAD